MDEPQWLNAGDPQAMLAFLRASRWASDCKFLLFACACQRRIWHLLEANAPGRKLAEMLEPYADGLTQRQHLPAWVSESSAGAIASILSRDAALSSARLGLLVAADEQQAQAGILRDLFGNPFRPPPSIAPSVFQWNSGRVKRLAEEAYEHRVMPAGTLDPQRLGLLADSLEEVGAETELVAHLRDPGPHVRGCHVVDLLMGRL